MSDPTAPAGSDTSGSRRHRLAAVARLAWRGVRHDRRRSLFVVLLIALPVAVGVFAGIVTEADTDPKRFVTARMGASEMVVELGVVEHALEPGAGPAILDRLLTSTESTGQIQAWTVVENASIERHLVIDGNVAITDLEVLAYDPEAPPAAGMLELREGRWPTAGEIALTPTLAQALALAPDDQVQLAADASALRVSGIVGSPYRLDATTALVTPNDLAAAVPDGARLEARGLVSTPDPIAVRNAVLASLESSQGAPAEIPEEIRAILDPRGWAEDEELYDGLSSADVAQLMDSLDLSDDQFEGVARGLARSLTMEDGGAVEVQDREAVQSRLLAHTAGGGLGTSLTVSTLVAMLLLVEVGLVAGAAFAAGIRRRLRDIGLLTSQGATSEHVRRIVVGEAVVAGLLAGLVGTPVGIAGAFAARPLVEAFRQTPVDTLSLDPVALAAPTVVAVLAAVVAAWLPARTAARIPTTLALQGRMPEEPPSRWVVPVGGVLAAFGTLLVVTATQASSTGGATLLATGGIGTVLMVTGVAMLAGPLVALLGRVAGRLPATARFAVRDAVRNRTRAAAAVAAAMIVLVAPVVITTFQAIGAARAAATTRPLDAGMTMLTASRNQGTLGPGQGSQLDEPVGQAAPEQQPEPVTMPEGVRADVQALLPEATIVAIERYHATVQPLDDISSNNDVEERGLIEDTVADSVAVATDELVAALDQAHGDDRVAEAHAGGMPVLLGIDQRTRSLGVEPSGPPGPVDGTESGESTRLGATEVATATNDDLPGLLLDQATITDLGLVADESASLLVVNDLPLTDDQLVDLRRLVAAHSTGQQFVFADALPAVDNEARVALAALAASAAVVALVVGLVTALSAVEARHDIDLAVAVGAAPSFRRRFLGLQTWLHVGLGALLAVPLGLLFTWVSLPRNLTVSMLGTFAPRVVVPWPVVGVLVGVVPVVLGLGAAVLVRSARVRPPRRIA